MARKLFKRFLPDTHTIRNHKRLQIFGKILHDPNLWHLNRRSASGGAAVGLFMGFMPMPFQMIPAAALAIYYRVNLPVAVVLVWITNPLTMPPLFYFCYKVGTWIIGRKENAFSFEPSWTWLTNELLVIWQPFLLGCLVVGSLSALVGFFSVRSLWRWHVIREWEERKRTRAKLP